MLKQQTEVILIIRDWHSVKKKVVILAAVICICVASAIIFSILFKDNIDIRNNNNALNSALQNISAETTTLDDVVPFDWDTAYYFSPYTSVERMAETMGVDSPELHESNYDDMINLVFVKEKMLVAVICEHKNNLGYDIEFDAPVSKGDNTLFSVTKKDGITLFSQIIRSG